jgi:hypothetical protein
MSASLNGSLLRSIFAMLFSFNQKPFERDIPGLRKR